MREVCRLTQANPAPAAKAAMTSLLHTERKWRGLAEVQRSKSMPVVRIFYFVATIVVFSTSAFAQAEFYPTFIISSNDVVQSSIMILRMGATNQAKVSIKFDYTEAGARRLEEFYAAHSVGQEIRYQSGKFEHVVRLDDRKHFAREGFWGLPERDAKALELGLRGQK